MRTVSPTVERERLRIVAIIALAFVPLLFIELALVQSQTQAGRDSIAAGRLALARSVASASDTFIDGNLATLRALTNTRSVKDADVQNVNAILTPILRQDPNWLTFGLSSADGWNLSSFTTGPHTVNISDRDYFQAALAGRDGVGSVLLTRGSLNTKTIVLAVPVTFNDGTKGVLSGALSLVNLERQLGQVVPSETIDLRMVDRLGHEFIGANAGGDSLPDENARPEVRDGLAGQSKALVAKDTRGRDGLLAYAPAVKAGWVVILSEPIATAFTLPDRLGQTAFVLTLLGVAAALAIAWYLGGRLARSYVEVDLARSIAQGERFRLYDALRHAPARVGLLNGPDLVYAVATPDQLDQVGMGEEDVIGKPFSAVDPEPTHRAILERVYNTGEPFIAKEMPSSVRLPNGQLVEGYYDAAIVPTHDAEGAIDGVIYYATDVTDLVKGRKRVEELAAAVSAERDELQQIVNEMPEGVIVMRRNGAVMSNRTAEELFGHPIMATDDPDDYAPRHADGRPYVGRESPIMRALDSGESVNGEEIIVRNPTRGVDLNILASAAPVRRDGEIVAAVSVFQDITELRAFERQRSEFFSMASHEIRTPVTAIQLQLDLALRQMSRGDSSRTEELIMKARQRTKALTALINDLLDVSRPDAGKFAHDLHDVDLVEIVQKAAGEYPTDPEHPILVVAAAKPLTVRADTRRVVEVIENLVNNAVKYSPERGTVTVEISTENDDAVVRVRDQGLGVPEAERGQIFERFFRTSVAKPYGGVGLGLYISKEIMTRLGGTITLESSSPRGSTFRVSLPLAPVPAPTR